MTGNVQKVEKSVGRPRTTARAVRPHEDCCVTGSNDVEVLRKWGVATDGEAPCRPERKREREGAWFLGGITT